MSVLLGTLGQTFLSAGAGDFQLARCQHHCLQGENTALESAVNRQAGKPALHRIA